MELNLKEDKICRKEEEHEEILYIKYPPINSLPTQEALPPNQRDKEVNALPISICITNKDTQNLTSQKELLLCNFRLVHIEFQHVKWLIRTVNLKPKENYRAVSNFERKKCSSCEFGKDNHQLDTIKTTNKNPMKYQ